MGSEWTQVSLGDLFSVKHGFAFKGEYFSESPTNNLLVTPGNFAIGGGFQEEKPKYYAGPIPEEYVLFPGDIIVTMTDLSKQSDTLGLSAVVPAGEQTWLHNQRIGLLQFHKDVQVDPMFVNYLLRTYEYRSWVIGSATGTTVKHTSPKRIQAYICHVPSHDEQKRIGEILSTLDQKIALNHQINTTLESMAQALFKSWFVDFDPVIDNALAAGTPIPEALKARAEARAALGDRRKPLPSHIRLQFPDQFVSTEEMGWVPEGWGIAPLSQTAELRTQSVHPGREPDKVWTHFSIPAFDDEMNPSYDLGETIKSGKYEVSKTAILASKLNPQFPRIWMPDVADENSSVCSTEFMPFVPKDPAERPYIYSLFCSDIMQSEISNRVTGSTGSRQRVKPKEIAELPVLTPSQSLRLAFCDIACSFFEKISVVQRENLALQKLRDTLLPKLLSGELRVPEAERTLEEVAL